MLVFSRQIEKQGFTLVELVVAISLFAFISVAATSAMISVIHANQLARAKVDAMNSISFAVESMVRELRVGREYNCSSLPTAGTINDCTGGQHLGFISSTGSFYEYALNGGVLQRQIDSSGWVDMVGSDVTIDSLSFDVGGSTIGDDEQPRVVLRIEGTAGRDSRTDAVFRIQTTVTQRFPDF